LRTVKSEHDQSRSNPVLQFDPKNANSRSGLRSRPLNVRINVWLRWLHVYTSMFSLMVVLFFAITGITLNHPDWVFGQAESRKESTGTLPATWRTNGKVNWLEVIEHLRATNGVRGRAEDMREDSSSEASVSFAAPGYRADAFVDSKTGAYKLTVTAQGIVAVINDFHKGRDAGPTWAWLIDLSGWFLVLVSVTGLGLLVYLKKFRISALIAMLVGTAIMLALMRVAS
jgi:uncharacterized protein